MKQWLLTAPDTLELASFEPPEPGPNEVAIRIRAASLNYRDLALKPNPGLAHPRVPVSDGAGEVLSVGPNVTRWKVGDRVMANFFPTWRDGRFLAAYHQSALGGSIDGMLREVAILPDSALLPIPEHLTFAEAATLPCAALTAWHALFERGHLTAGQSVLILGTGGVSIFALQFAKLAGARCLVTSSSDDKLARAQAMGADVTINYLTTPDWEHAVQAATNGQGVDHVVEVGGAGTFQKSLRSTAFGGQVHLIGVLTGVKQELQIFDIIHRALDVHGVYVGSVAMFEGMNAALSQSQIRPVIDRIFGFDSVPDAYAHLASGNHFGKVVVEL